MHFILCMIAFSGIILVHAQEKGNIIPFPRVGRSPAQYFMSEKRSSGASPGLIPFPRIGRSSSDFQKRQLIPFPRVGKRPYWHNYPMEPQFLFNEYDDAPSAFPYAGFSMDTADRLSSDHSTGEPMMEENTESMDKRSPNGSGMWFGPRLGRKKRSISESESMERSRDSLDTKTLINILHNFKWAIVPIKERPERRTFTPRLGRSSHEKNSRSTPFNPRLGRSHEVVSFEDDDDDDRNQSRYSRGDGSTQQPPEGGSNHIFSPRLGRDHFSPRLGRSEGGDDHPTPASN